MKGTNVHSLVKEEGGWPISKNPYIKINKLCLRAHPKTADEINVLKLHWMVQNNEPNKKEKKEKIQGEMKI